MTTDSDSEMFDRLMELEGRELDRQNAQRASALGDAIERAGGNREYHRLVDGELNFDNDGNATNAEELVQKTREQYPGLFRGGRGALSSDINERIRAAAGRSRITTSTASRQSQPRNNDGTFKGPGKVDAGARTPVEPGGGKRFNDMIRRAAGR